MGDLEARAPRIDNSGALELGIGDSGAREPEPIRRDSGTSRLSKNSCIVDLGPLDGVSTVSGPIIGGSIACRSIIRCEIGVSGVFRPCRGDSEVRIGDSRVCKGDSRVGDSILWRVEALRVLGDGVSACRFLQG